MADKGTGNELSSQWGKLSNHLVATFYEVDRHGNRVKDANGNTINITVRAPLTECSLDIALNWQSSFESMSPETKAPTLFAMLQSGAVQPAIDALDPVKSGKIVGRLLGGNAGDRTAQTIADVQKNADGLLRTFEGRTGITKLNSTQVFSGMPPIKIQATALFRAWADPIKEVAEPFDQLMAWAFPEQLAPEGTVTNFIKAAQGEKSPLEALLPSKAPKLIAMTYKKRAYKPFVIELSSIPLSSSVDANGDFVELLIPITLTSLTAWDAQDWANSKM